MIKLGDSYSEQIVITDALVRAFSEISGDKNPIHLDEEYASKTVFGRRIAHGLLVGSFISKVLGNKLPGKGTIYLKQEFNFLAPVFIGQSIEVRVTVAEKKENKPIYKILTECFSGSNKVLDGYAIVKFEGN